MKCNICRQRIFHKRGLKVGLCSSCIKGLEPVVYTRHITTISKTHYKLSILFSYTKTAQDLIRLFKFKKETVQARSIVALIAESINLQNEPDIIVPVPSHFIDEVKRGFSHTAYMTSLLSKVTGYKLDIILAKKMFPLFNRNQKYKNKEQRQKSINRFYLRKDSSVKGKKVLLVDDVFTTGNTIKECSEVLSNNGAKSVEAICFALSPM